MSVVITGSQSPVQTLTLQTSQVSSSLTLGLSPNPAPIGTTVVASGKLTRSDGGTIPDALVIDIQLQAGAGAPWNTIVQVYTYGNGSYGTGLYASDLPTTPGTYNVRASFAGATVAGMSIMGSVSSPVGLTTQGVPTPTWQYVAVGVGVAAAIIVAIIIIKKRRR